MPIFKADVCQDYTQIPNKTARDSSLTFEARGLLTMLLSLPPNWEIHKSWLQGQAMNCGRDKLTRLLVELQDAGYMRKEAVQSKNGRMGGVNWYVYPSAELKNRSTENPLSGHTATTKERVLQKKNDTNLGAPSGDALTQTEQPKPKKKTKAQQLFDQVRSNRNYQYLNAVDNEVLIEWAKLRVQKKASPSDRALKTIDETLATLWHSHNIQPQKAIEAQCDAGWATIKVEYLANKGLNNQAGFESPTSGWSAGLADEMGWDK